MAQLCPVRAQDHKAALMWHRLHPAGFGTSGTLREKEKRAVHKSEHTSWNTFKRHLHNKPFLRRSCERRLHASATAEEALPMRPLLAAASRRREALTSQNQIKMQICVQPGARPEPPTGNPARHREGLLFFKHFPLLFLALVNFNWLFFRGGHAYAAFKRINEQYFISFFEGVACGGQRRHFKMQTIYKGTIFVTV